MAKTAPRRVNGVQKLVLYLILANLLLVTGYALMASRLGTVAALAVPLLLVCYNLLLSQLVIRRSRRTDDTYILYPVVISILVLAFAMLRALFL
ncbi:hypothetical protein PVT67_04675 [Gallaecimonas kandeliae]|uniref:hypothetical protein n=1 Tax=Gallaecimonas kandeliae TaxID=3029055 RepID=UPI0026471E0B|nr:hypothetical protein [Gallaecimonas kandeliae]WKE66549.1 hypothetical protein PVT67_04675 [Gallaecimonas kandeliae]